MNRKIVFAVILLLCLAGCASPHFHVVGDENYPDYRIFEFRDDSRQFSHTLQLDAGDTVVLGVILRDGNLQILVEETDGGILYREDAASSGSMDLSIPSAGEYVFTFTTTGADGNITMTAIRAPQQKESTDAPQPAEPTQPAVQQPETVPLTVYIPQEDGTLVPATCDGIDTPEGVYAALAEAGVIDGNVEFRELTKQVEQEKTVYTLNLSQAFCANATRQLVQCIVNTYLANLGGDSMLITAGGAPLQTEDFQMDEPWPFSETVTGEEPEPPEQLSGPMLALTFDDGPSQYTPQILDLLETYDATATFFVVGSRVDTYSDTISRAIQLGCEIGNHTVNHVDLTNADMATLAKEIGDCNNSVCQNTGYTPSLLRPPYGSTNQSVRENVGMPLILWSIDTRDWESRDAAAVIDEVLDQVQDGDIVLMHDLYGSTAEACKTIIPELIARGYQLVTVSQLAQAKGIDLENGERYFSFR